jgi:hypothetical protein
MAHTWKYAFGLGLIGAALSMSCTVTTDDDSGTGAIGGDTSSGGTGGSSSGNGGTGGSTGGSSTGGSSTGGSSETGGSGGTTSGSGGTETGGTTGGTGDTTGGTSGTTGGTGDMTGGTGGTGGTGSQDTTPTCDPLPDTTTEFPNCDPGQGSEDDACAKCQQSKCCDLVKTCRSYDPYNVCAWGGPAEGDPNYADYGGAGEIGCIVSCMTDYVTSNEVCDQDGIDMCTSLCATQMCGSLPGDATNNLFGCVKDNCSKDCFGSDTCG